MCRLLGLEQLAQLAQDLYDSDNGVDAKGNQLTH